MEFWNQFLISYRYFSFMTNRMTNKGALKKSFFIISLKIQVTDRDFVSGILYSEKTEPLSFLSACCCQQALAIYPPESGGPPSNSGVCNLAPHKVYSATPVARSTGALLPHLFTLTPPRAGRFFSAALAVSALRQNLPVRKYGALWCPDFPSHT